MIITLTGPNDYASSQVLRDLTDRFVAKFGTAGLERIDGERFAAANLAELLQGASLFTPQRLVILRGAAMNKSLWESLGDWLNRVPSETTLIVVEANPDKRTRTYKQLKKLSDFKEFAELEPPQLAAWLQKIAGQQGGELDAKTASYLVQRAGANQWRLHQELQKLLAHNMLVTPESIDALVEATPQAGAFELLDAALARKPALVADLLSKLSTDEDPFKLFGLLVSQVCTLAIVQSAGSRPADVIAKEAGVHPFVVRKMQGVARGVSATELKRIIDAVALLDTQLKSTGAEPWLLLRQCLQKIAA